MLQDTLLTTFCVVHTVNRFDFLISKQQTSCVQNHVYVQFCNEAKSCAYWLVNKILWYETETFNFQSETRSRPSHISTRPRRLETTSRDRDVETETTSLRVTIMHTLLLTTILKCLTWFIQPFGYNSHGPIIGGDSAPGHHLPFGRGGWVPI